jgi:glucose/arabinose dehydrogenase
MPARRENIPRMWKKLCRLTFGVVALGLAVQSPAATLPSGFTETQIVSSLGGAPTAMAFAPDGRLFVCLQTGQLRVVKNGALLATPFLSLSVDSAGERGLLGIAFDPNFAANAFVYVYYTVPANGATAAHNRVSRFVANGDVATGGSEVVILDLNPLSSATNHNGGAIHFGPDGKLYVAVGENANGANAQTLSNLLGKMLRLNPDGTVPTDNPFYNSASGINRAIWALGLRNPFTFAFQPGTTRMFINDVGQSTWEEIDDGIAGSNYGWPTTEGPTTDARFRSPIFSYGHGNTDTTSIAITGGAFYNPATPQFPASYVGKYFFADYGSGWIRVLDPANNTASSFAGGISAPVDLHVAPDGTLYYAARGNGGQIYRIQATPSQPMNISSRARVGTGDNAAIAGFIVSGTGPKNLLARAIGPSLQQPNVNGPLADPTLDIYAADGTLLAHNENWRDTQQQQIQNTGLAPTSDLESAVIGPLSPGSYTAVVRGKNNGTGVGLVEIYDLDAAAASRLANISTRAFVGTSSDVLIGGFILGGGKIGAAKLIVRAIGPSLAQRGIANALLDPTLELHDGNGTLLVANDNWQENTDQAAQLRASGIAPTNDLESAIATSLAPGAYTAIVAGKNASTGTAVVEIYNLP